MWSFSTPEDVELFINQFNQPVVILMYIRPQVPLLNSAYWQWGAWADQDPREWIMSYSKGYSNGIVNAKIL